MKELSIEEKAKHYDEAIKKVNDYYEGKTKLYSDVDKTLNYLFPELKESKDERIRKDIIGFLITISSLKDGKTVSNEDFDSKAILEWVAWLEKIGSCQNNVNYNTAESEKRKFVGIYDKNKNPIYEGDYVKVKTGRVCKVAYKSTNCFQGWDLVPVDDIRFPNNISGTQAPNEYDLWASCNLEIVDMDGEQNHVDKVESKFKIGDWISNGRYTKLIVGINSDWSHYMFNDGTPERIKDIDKKYHLWTIADAKDGDVLALISGQSIFLFDGYDKEYCHYSKLTNSFSPNFNYIGFIQHQFVPATKEQRNQLEKAMADAGYEWNAEKKELKKIEQKPVWSEEDEEMLENIIICADKDYFICKEHIDWLKSLKDRLQPKQEWSEEDEIALGDALWCCKQAASNAKDENDMGSVWYAKRWLKSLKDRVQPQNTWKPSDEQMNALRQVISGCSYDIEPLVEMEEQLKKLREE